VVQKKFHSFTVSLLYVHDDILNESDEPKQNHFFGTNNCSATNMKTCDTSKSCKPRPPPRSQRRSKRLLALEESLVETEHQLGERNLQLRKTEAILEAARADILHLESLLASENESKSSEPPPDKDKCQPNDYEHKHEPCPSCYDRCGKIEMTGRQLDPTTMYGAAERTYIVCAHCKFCYSSYMM